MALLFVALAGCATTATPQIAPSPTNPPPVSTSAPTLVIETSPEPSIETAQPRTQPSTSPPGSSSQPPATPASSDIVSIPRSASDIVSAFLELAIADDGSSVRAMGDSGDQSYIPVLVDYLRFMRPSDVSGRDIIVRALRDLSEVAPDEVVGSDQFWSWWVKWLGKHAEVAGPEGYDEFKGLILERLVDPEMAVFFSGGIDTRIRLEEIVWGGVAKDGIPDLTNPPILTTEDATYIFEPDRVFGVSFNGEHRAYPLRILNAHEMANDVVGGVPFALAH